MHHVIGVLFLLSFVLQDFLSSHIVTISLFFLPKKRNPFIAELKGEGQGVHVLAQLSNMMF